MSEKEFKTCGHCKKEFSQKRLPTGFHNGEVICELCIDIYDEEDEE